MSTRRQTGTTAELESRFGRFFERFKSEAMVAAVLGGEKLPAGWVGAQLIGRLFPVPLVHIDSEARLTREQLWETLEPALDSGKLVLVTLGPSTDQELLGLMEELIRDKSFKALKPQGWVSITCHHNFRMLIHSPGGSFPFDEFVDLKLHLG